MSAAPARFTFDTNFAPGASQRAGLTDAAVAEMTRESQAAGRAIGFAEGEQSATADAARALTEAAELLAERAAGALALFDAAEARHRIEAVELAATIARKLAAHLVARQPAAELEALLVDCIASLRDVPHVLVRCHPELADGLREAAEQRAALSGYSGRLMVVGDEALGLTDGRIEWVDGGAARDMSAIARDIENRITAYIGAAAPGDQP